MADNFDTNAGSGGKTFASDQISTVDYPIAKLAHGALDSATLVSTSSGLPVQAQGAFPVTDNSGSLTVDNAGTFAVQADTELTTADLDTGAGSDTRAVVGLVLAASGGGLLVGSANPMPISDNSGSITVDGSLTTVSTVTTITNVVHVDDNSSTLSVDDGAGSLTIDNAALSVTGTGTESGALRVTIATDSTGVLSVDDNGGNLSIDDGGNSITVDGSVTVTQGTGSNLHTVIDSGTVTTITNVVHVDDNSGSLTVDGTVSLNPATSGGWSIDSRTGLTNTAVAAKASAGQVGGWVIHNPAAATTFIQIFNVAAASVTLGTTTPTMVVGIPAGATANVEFANGIAFGTAISWAATTTATGSTAPASAAVAALLYK